MSNQILIIWIARILWILTPIIILLYIFTPKNTGCNIFSLRSDEILILTISGIILWGMALILTLIGKNEELLNKTILINTITSIFIVLGLLIYSYGTFEISHNFSNHFAIQSNLENNTAKVLFESNDYNAFPKVLKLQNNSLWAVWYQGNWHIDTNNDGKLMQSFSHDDGVNWEEPTVLYDDSALDTRNMIINQLDNGSLMCTYLLYDYETRATRDTQWIRSNDGGLTWTEPKTIKSTDYNPVGKADFTWLSPFGDVFRKDNDNGEYLAPFYGGNEDGTNNNVILLKYDNNTDEWKFYSNAMNETGKTYNEAKIVRLGTEYLCISRSTNGYLYYSYSEDCLNWEKPLITPYKLGHAPELVILEKDSETNIWKMFCSYRGENTFLKGGLATFNPLTKNFTCEDTILHTSLGNGGGDAGYSSGTLLSENKVGFVNYEVLICGDKGGEGTKGTILWQEWIYNP